MKNPSSLPALIMAMLIGSYATEAMAGAVITTGGTSLGVNDQGHLNFFDNGPGGFLTYGIFRDGVGDSISPGCLCEGWGVAVTHPTGVRVFANASIDNGGIDNLLPTGSFGSTPNTATSIVQMSNAPVEIAHRFGPSLAPEIFQVQVTIENNSTTDTLSDIVYRRTMDWDIPPTTFDERVTHQGVVANLEANGGNIRFASDNGFADSNPLAGAGSILPGTINTDFADSGPTDHGSVFDFAFGDLAPGAQRTFNIFYGSAPDEPTAVDRVQNTLGANAWSFGQQSVATTPDGQPATFIFAFGGVGGVEPGTTPNNPVLPFVPAPAEFIFLNPQPRRWFDPPFVEAFEYELTGGATFTEVIAPPASFGFGPVSVFIPGIGEVGMIGPGESFDFLAAGFSDVSVFRLLGIDPLLDAADPGFATAFPTFLDWTGTAEDLMMTGITTGSPPVPEPPMIIIMLGGIVILIFMRRRFRMAA